MFLKKIKLKVNVFTVKDQHFLFSNKLVAIIKVFNFLINLDAKSKI